MSLAELFPAEAALGVPPPAALEKLAIADLQGAEAGTDPGPGRRMPLVAGTVVALAVLCGGAGIRWWRNRDTAYWPA